MPATGFYEWQRRGKQKVPYFIHLQDEEIFSLAGLYDIWRDAAGQPLATYTIVTTTPNELMVDVHDRMPVILPRDEEAEWLDPNLQDPAVLQPLLQPYPADAMVAYRVSNAVNRVTNDSPDLIAPL